MRSSATRAHSTDHDLTADVVIVGAGPVGLTLATLLGRRGWEVVVLERQPAPYPLPRAVHFDHEVARIFQSIGAMEFLTGRLEAMDTYEWRSATGATLLTFGIEGVAGPSGWAASTMFSQPDLEAALGRLVGALSSVRVRRGCEVVGIDQSDGAAVVSVIGEQGAGTLSARWVVGCDGAGSTVRTLLGARVTDWDCCFDWLIVDVMPDEPARWRPLNLQICDPARPTTAVSGGPGRRRFEFMRLPSEAPEALTGEDVAWRLLAPWSLTPANSVLERHANYTFVARLVEGWRDRHVLLAGDAVHQMPPFAGQGLCSGLRDVANLAWKLDLVLSGAARAPLLDTYESERAPQVRAEIEFSVELGRVICVTDPAEAAERDRVMAEAASASGPLLPPPEPPIGPGVVRHGDPGAGQLAHQGVIEHEGRRGRADDLLGAGWLLLGADAEPQRWLTEEQREWFAGLGGRIVGLGAGSAVRDVETTYRSWLDSLPAAVVLQRPDFHLFGSAPDPEGAAALLEDLASALGRTGRLSG